MRNGRAITTFATLALAIGLATAPGALANAPSTETATPETSKPATETPVTEASKPVVEKPVTEKPVTEVPVTEVPDTEVPETEGPTCENTPSLEGCTPDTPDIDEPPIEDTPGKTPVKGDGTLPFTGPGDVVLAVVLALLAGTGGILFLFGAAGREAIEGLNRRDMSSPSGFKLAYRELLKQQMKG